MVTVSFSMSDELIDRLDGFAAEHGYPGRSIMIREAIRSFIEQIEEVSLEDRALVGIVTVTFSYEGTNVEERLIDLRHEHDDLVVANVHNHTRNRQCIELFVLEGELEDLSTFIEAVRSMKAPIAVNHSLTPVDEL
ncbi:CopG family ribbon-helix-helix protein [Halococcus hamelinensis]|uniref:Putative nickel-responsive regulator n=1 Tax=Halococcus hamelinensis 100A6 TaxID=1132509 RepID=M0M7Z9_9EURY|nr:CopG family ribbon-helix-helix protein [Halococcus hamelinensis]EMA41942.1 transcriptional regulator NikR [Halococcus hamelinensis 100A6]